MLKLTIFLRYRRKAFISVREKVNKMKQDYLVWHRGGSGWYKLFKDGRIEKPDGYMSDGKSWEFVGLVEKRPFGRVGPLIEREECFKMYVDQLKFKNGKMKYLVVDRDSGTIRIWMT